MNHLSPEILDAYAEGWLTPGERTEVDAHLAKCGQCRLALASLAQLGDALREQPRVVPPPALAAHIIAALEPSLPRLIAVPSGGQPTPAANWRRVAWHFLGAVGAWLLLIVLGGETLLAAYRGGLGEMASLVRSHPDLVARYPTEALYALLESIPIIELSLTLVTLVTALWLMQRFVALLPEGRRA